MSVDDKQVIAEKIHEKVREMNELIRIAADTYGIQVKYEYWESREVADAVPKMFLDATVFKIEKF